MQSWLEQVPIAGWILWWIAETLLFGQMLRWLFVHAGRDKAVQEDGIGKGIGKRIFLIFAGLLIAWLPVLLSHDPGFYNYDIYGQVPQVMYPEVPYNTHHSLLSTLVMGGVIIRIPDLRDDGEGSISSLLLPDDTLCGDLFLQSGFLVSAIE